MKSGPTAIKTVATQSAARLAVVSGQDAASQRARAYQGFTQQILSGGIRPGQFVSQRELMTLLDMPLGAVREMIPRLEAAGLIRTVPQRGLQIAHVDLKLIRNAFQVRAMIEREAVLNFISVASDAEIDAIEASHRDILQRASRHEGGTITDARLLDDAQAIDWGLHDRMVDALGNEIMSEMYRVNSLRIRLISLENPMQLQPSFQEHLDFISALRRRDGVQARQLMGDHIESARNRVLQASLGQWPVRAGSSVQPPAQQRVG